MVTLQSFMKIIPWPLIIFILFFAVIIIIAYKDKKDFFTLIRRVKKENYSDEELAKEINCYIKRHPFSLYLSDLRLKIIPSLLAIQDINSAQEMIYKIRFVDVHNQLINNILYVLFLLHESDGDHGLGFSSLPINCIRAAFHDLNNTL